MNSFINATKYSIWNKFVGPIKIFFNIEIIEFNLGIFIPLTSQVLHSLSPSDLRFVLNYTMNLSKNLGLLFLKNVTVFSFKSRANIYQSLEKLFLKQKKNFFLMQEI